MVRILAHPELIIHAKLWNIYKDCNDYLDLKKAFHAVC